MGELTVLIVNYDSGELLRRCIASLDRDPFTAAAPVIVVDNASTDGSADGLPPRPAGLRVLRLAEDRGFGAGNNAGLALCDTPFVLMANPDTEVLSGSASALVAAMAARPRLGLLGCRLVDTEGALLKTVRNLPTVTRELSEALFLHRFVTGRGDRLVETVQDRAAYDVPRPAGWVSGAVMLARVEAMRDVGGFDEGFFLYAEEIDLSRRLQDAGWEVGYDPALTMLHVGGEYTTDPALALENQRSKLRYFLKHEGRLRMLAFAAVIVLRLLVRGVLLTASAVRRGDELFRRRARTAFSTLRRYPGLVAEFAVKPRPSAVTGEPTLGKEGAS